MGPLFADPVKAIVLRPSPALACCFSLLMTLDFRGKMTIFSLRAACTTQPERHCALVTSDFCNLGGQGPRSQESSVLFLGKHEVWGRGRSLLCWEGGGGALGYNHLPTLSLMARTRSWNHSRSEFCSCRTDAFISVQDAKGGSRTIGRQACKCMKADNIICMKCSDTSRVLTRNSAGTIDRKTAQTRTDKHTRAHTETYIHTHMIGQMDGCSNHNGQSHKEL